MKKNILIVSSTFPSSDADPVPAFVKDFIVSLKRYNPSFHFTVLAPHDLRSSTQSFTRRPEYDEYRFHYMWPRKFERLAGRGGILPSLKKSKLLYLVVPFFLLAEFFAIIRVTKKVKPDLINAHWLIPQGLVTVLTKPFINKPVVITIHGSDIMGLNGYIMKNIKRLSLRSSSLIICNSTATKSVADDLSDGESIIIPMGVETQQTQPVNKRFLPKKARLLFVGRFSEEKGIDYLIEALKILDHQKCNFTATLVGEGPESARVSSLILSSGLEAKVKLTGWAPSSDLAGIYTSHDIFIGPSIREGLGVAFIEAGSYGLPLIGTDAGGIKDIIQDGVNGFIVPKRNPRAIANSVLLLINDPSLYDKLSRSAATSVTEKFSWDRVARLYSAAYIEALK